MALAARQTASASKAQKRGHSRSIGPQLEQIEQLFAAGEAKRADRQLAKLMRAAPKHPKLMLMRARAALAQGDPQGAITWAERVRLAVPDDIEAALLIADIATRERGTDAGLDSLRAVLETTGAMALRKELARRLYDQRRHMQVLELLQPALRAPEFCGEMFWLMGRCLEHLGQHAQAAATYELGGKLHPSEPRNFLRRAMLAQHHFAQDPRPHLLEALQAQPGHDLALVHFLWASLARCDWDSYARLLPAPAQLRRLGLGDVPLGAWFTLPMLDDPAAARARQARSERDLMAKLGLGAPGRAPLPAPHPQGKIRIGYFSNDYYTHATMYLFAGLLRHHDRARFELHCFDYGPTDALGAAALAQFDHVHPIQSRPREEVVRLARGVGLDIAVNLKGDTTNARRDIFLMGLAPVQINYLGFPGTMGTAAYDYIIGDEVVIPPALEPHYAEAVIRLPTCYLPIDDALERPPTPPRAELGLPEGAVVLACMNDHYKIAPELFDLWMQALIAVPEAVLWLIDGTEEGKAHLIGRAEAQGVAAARIHFAPKLKHDLHIARLAQADLYLDTFNVNGHTLSADALCYAQVPMLTRAGQQFAARVGASFATAAGLPDLVTQTSAAYLSKLIELASDPAKRAALRQRLADNRSTRPLFSSVAYTRCLEEGLAAAHSRARQGLPPSPIRVPPESAAPMPKAQG